MKHIAWLLLLAIGSPAHAALLHLSQFGIDDRTGQQIRFSAYAHTDAVIDSNFEILPREGGVYVDPNWNIRLSHIRLDLGSQVIESAIGEWMFGGDLASPNTYDAFYTFSFGGWQWSANEARLDGRIGVDEFTGWDDPIEGVLTSRTVRSRDGYVFTPEGTRLSRFLFGQVGNLEITVVPEAATSGLLAIGLIALGFGARRRRQLRASLA